MKATTHLPAATRPHQTITYLARLLLLFAFCAASPATARGQLSKVAKTLSDRRVQETLMVTGFALIATVGISWSVETCLEMQSIDDAIISLKEQGITTPDSAIYSIYFTLNGNEHAVKWADIVGRPDVYVVLVVEGQGSYLVPGIHNGYKGGPILNQVIAKKSKPGCRVSAYILDDDSLTNEIWNSILQSSVNWKINAGFNTLGLKKKDWTVKTGLEINAEANGSFRILRSDQTIKAPDVIAVAEVQVPAADTVEQLDQWIFKGDLIASSGKHLGTITLRQLGCLRWEKYEQLVKQKQRAIFWMVFSGMIGILGLALFIKYGLMNPKKVTTSAIPS